MDLPEPLLLELDRLFRYGAIVVLILVCIEVVLERAPSLKILACTASVFATACYLLEAGPIDVWDGIPTLSSVIQIGSLLAPVFICWVVLEISLDRPGWYLLSVAILALFCVPTVVLDHGLWFTELRSEVNLAVFSAVFATVILSNRDDLVSSRRKFRLWALIPIAVLTLSITFSKLLFDGVTEIRGYLIQSGSVFVTSLLVFTLCFYQRRRPGSSPVRAALNSPNKQRLVEEKKMSELLEAMDKDIWKQENLTITSLAEQVGIPEHRLRATINQGLGYRNFATFINERRISAAEEMLSDPSLADTSILEIAFESGFASLSTFNRAFRTINGSTPTEFREKSLPNFGEFGSISELKRRRG